MIAVARLNHAVLYVRDLERSVGFYKQAFGFEEIAREGGTVARLQLKPGEETQMQEQMKEYERLNVPGYVGTTLFRMDNNPNEVYLTVVFESKEAYFANANNPAQNARYKKMRAMLVSDPEWHDGEVIYKR